MVKARKRGKQITARHTPPKIDERCFNCKKAVTMNDYCYGCNSFVCPGCDERGANGAVGGHLPEHHLTPFEGFGGKP
jgi:hypothetical protein